MRSLLNVIKASQYDALKSIDSSKAVHSNPLNPHEQQDIVEEAVQKARDIVEAAETYSMNQLKESTMRMNEECAQMKIRSYEDGYSQGLAEGRKEGKEAGYRDGYEEGLRITGEEKQRVIGEIKTSNKAAEQELKRMLEAIESQKEEILRRFEADIRDLAIAVARKVMRKEVSLDEKAIKAIILDVMDSYRNQEWVKISISQSSAELLSKADRSVAEDLKGISDNVKIVSLPELKDSDCLIEMPDRVIDAGMETQLEAVKTAFERRAVL